MLAITQGISAFVRLWPYPALCQDLASTSMLLPGVLEPSLLFWSRLCCISSLSGKRECLITACLGACCMKTIHIAVVFGLASPHISFSTVTETRTFRKSPDNVGTQGRPLCGPYIQKRFCRNKRGSVARAAHQVYVRARWTGLRQPGAVCKKVRATVIFNSAKLSDKFGLALYQHLMNRLANHHQCRSGCLPR